MPAREPRDDDGLLIERLERRVILSEQVIAAQSEAMRVLSGQVGELKSSMEIVEKIQEDWQLQKVTRAAWMQTMKFVQAVVVVVAAAAKSFPSPLWPPRRSHEVSANLALSEMQ